MVAGASALGLDYVLRTPPVMPNQTSTVSVSSTVASPTSSFGTTDMKLTLFADWHGDGVQQSDEPAINNIPVEITGLDNDYRSVLVAEGDGAYWARNIPVGKQYRITLMTDKFRYVALSNSDFAAIDHYPPYAIASPEPSLKLGLMEGFLTLPFKPQSHVEIDRFYDRDPDPDRYLWWDRERGLDEPKYVNGVFRGWSPNHNGIDYYVSIGTQVLAACPGKVIDIGEDEQGGTYVTILHRHNIASYGFQTVYAHLSSVMVSLGDRVLRGQEVAKSGMSGKNTTLKHYPHLHFRFETGRNGEIYLDPYRPTFEVKSPYAGYWTLANQWIPLPVDSYNPNLLNYWTKDDDPKYAVT